MAPVVVASLLVVAILSVVGANLDVSTNPRGVPISISSLAPSSLAPSSLAPSSLAPSSGPPPPPPPSAWNADCLVAPVPGPIVQFFQRPDCPYCAGHRTVDFAVGVGDVIRSPVAGRVSYSGFVAGIGYVTVVPAGAPTHLVTVGGVVPAVISETIASGDHIGTAQGPDVVRLSVRRAEVSGLKTYLDPEPLLARWRVRARLVDSRSGDTGPSRRPGRAEYGCRPT